MDEELPIGLDGTLDMRFHVADRPVAKKLLQALRSTRTSINRMLIAVSGAGKTSCMFQVAREVFMVYIPCTTRQDANNFVMDARHRTGSFVFLDDAVKQLKATTVDPTVGAKLKSMQFLVANFYVLWVFLTKYPGATPIQCLSFQMLVGGGRQIVEMVFSELQNMNEQQVKDLGNQIRIKLHPLLGGRPLVLAVDEMEGAMQAGNDFVSRNNKQERG